MIECDSLELCEYHSIHQKVIGLVLNLVQLKYNIYLRDQENKSC